MDLLNLASQWLMDQIDSKQKLDCNIKRMTANSLLSSACLKAGNNVDQNDSNKVVGASCK